MNPFVRAAVDDILLARKNAGEVAKITGAVEKSAAKPSDITIISTPEVNKIISAAAAEFGVPIAALLLLLELEAGKLKVRGNTYYNRMSLSPGKGTYKGLMQMGQGAWDTAKQVWKSLPEFHKSWMDARANVRAAAAYAAVNAKVIRSHGYTGSVTPEVYYAMHNQGAGGFMHLVNGIKSLQDPAVTGQSQLAQSVIRRAVDFVRKHQ